VLLPREWAFLEVVQGAAVLSGSGCRGDVRVGAGTGVDLVWTVPPVPSR